jgi:hypothetical protein
MEVILGCRTAEVSVLDEDAVPVVTFYEVEVLGDISECTRKGFDAAFRANPGLDFGSE